MKQLPLINKYGDNTFFVAYIQISEKHKRRTVLRASDMAEELTEQVLFEHFDVDKKEVSEIKIVQAYASKQITRNELHQKQIFTFDPKSLVEEPAVPFTPVIILQVIAFDRFKTDAFFVKDLMAAYSAMEKECNTAIVLNTIHTRIIKNLKFN